MADATRVARQLRRPARRTVSTRRPASWTDRPRPYVASPADPDALPTVTPAAPGAAPVVRTARRSTAARVKSWFSDHPGHVSTPSEQSLDSIAHIAYFRHR